MCPFPSFYSWLVASWHTGEIWDVVTALATVAGCWTIWYAGRQLELQAWLRVQELWTNKEFRSGRMKLYKRLEVRNEKWTDPEREEALEVCRKLDEFAALVPYLKRHEALRIFGVPFSSCWLVLKEVVDDERSSKPGRANWPEKWKPLERFGNASLKKHSNLFENKSFLKYEYAKVAPNPLAMHISF